MWSCSDTKAFAFGGESFPCLRGKAPKADGGSQKETVESGFAANSSALTQKDFALAHESLFFACARKNNQKKAHPASRPPRCAMDSRSEWCIGKQLQQPNSPLSTRSSFLPTHFWPLSAHS